MTPLKHSCVVGDRISADKYLLGVTLLLTLILFCLATYILAVNHEFYCEAHPKWQNWTQEWLIAGLVPGWFALSALIDWAIVVVNNIIAGHTKARRTWKLLPPVGILVILVPVACAVALAASPVVGLFVGLQWLFLGTTPSWAKRLVPQSLLRNNGVEDNAPAVDLELGDLAHVGEGHSGQVGNAARHNRVGAEGVRGREVPADERPERRVEEPEVVPMEDVKAAFPHRKGDGPPPYIP